MVQLIEIIKRYWFSLSVLALLVTTALSLSPLDGLPEAPGSDKTHHLIAYAAVAYPTALRKPKRWLAIILCFAFYSGLIEIIQPWVHRYGEWMDVQANIVGLILGVMLAKLTNRLMRYRSKY